MTRLKGKRSTFSKSAKLAWSLVFDSFRVTRVPRARVRLGVGLGLV